MLVKRLELWIEVEKDDGTPGAPFGGTVGPTERSSLTRISFGKWERPGKETRNDEIKVLIVTKSIY